jgi:hypothetical protein
LFRSKKGSADFAARRMGREEERAFEVEDETKMPVEMEALSRM